MCANVNCSLFAFTKLPANIFSDPGVHFHAGLSDCKVIIGEAAELECKLSSEECEGIWYKDGEEVSLGSNSGQYTANISMLYLFIYVN